MCQCSPCEVKGGGVLGSTRVGGEEVCVCEEDDVTDITGPAIGPLMRVPCR